MQQVTLDSKGVPVNGGYVKIDTKYGIQNLVINVWQSVSGCNVDLVDSNGNLVGETNRSKGDKSLSYYDLPAGTYYMFARSYKNEPARPEDQIYEYLFFKYFDVDYYYKKLI